MTREQMRAAVEQGRATELDDHAIRFRRWLDMDHTLREEPGAIVRLRPDLSPAGDRR